MGDVHQEPVQSVLLPPPAVEIRCLVGIVQRGDHAQMQVEVRSATDSTLIDLWSNPHATLSNVPAALDQAVAELRRAVLYWSNPFP